MKLFLAALLAGASAVAYAQASPKYLDYIDEYAPLAIAEMHASGIPASITLSQGLLESGAGQSTLAKKANNHFGIKCHSDWKGKRMYRKDDDRNKHGKLIESCFRSYGHPAESYADHSAFLTGGRRYAGLFLLAPDDYKGWARGLKKAGYATSKTYAQKLIGIIESYQLYTYDAASAASGRLAAADVITQHRKEDEQRGRPALSGAARRVPTAPAERTAPTQSSGGVASASAKTRANQTRFANDVKYTYASSGETIGDIARRTNRRASDLVKYNELIASAKTRPHTSDRIYLQPKRKSYRGKQKRHIVRRGETVQAIADAYALRTDALRERNRMPAGREPRAGQKLWLRGRRKRGSEVKLRATDAIAQRPVTRRTSPSKSRATASASGTHTTSSRIGPSSPTQPGSHLRTTASRTDSQLATTDSNVPTHSRVGSRPRTTSTTSTQRRPPATATSRDPIATPSIVTVSAGDTLWSISRRAGVSVPELRALNSLDGDTIHVGQRLVVGR